MDEEQIRILLYIVYRLEGSNPRCPICDYWLSDFSDRKLCECIERRLISILDGMNND